MLLGWVVQFFAMMVWWRNWKNWNKTPPFIKDWWTIRNAFYKVSFTCPIYTKVWIFEARFIFSIYKMVEEKSLCDQWGEFNEVNMYAYVGSLYKNISYRIGGHFCIDWCAWITTKLKWSVCHICWLSQVKYTNFALNNLILMINLKAYLTMNLYFLS